MAHPLRFLGMMVPVLPWDEQLRRYKHLEELGFDLAGVATILPIGKVRRRRGSRAGRSWRRSQRRPRAFGWRPGSPKFHCAIQDCSPVRR